MYQTCKHEYLKKKHHLLKALNQIHIIQYTVTDGLINNFLKQRLKSEIQINEVNQQIDEKTKQKNNDINRKK